MPDLPSLPSPHPPDDKAVLAALHTALDEGVTLFDTARAYATADTPGYGEAMIAKAISTHPDGALAIVATKGGHYRDGATFPIDARPVTLRRHCELSLRTLGVDRLDLYQLHHPDPHVPLHVSVETLADLQAEGLIRHIGVSNLSIDQIHEARSVARIASVQCRFGPFDQASRSALEYCAEEDIAFLAFSSLHPHPRSPRIAAQSLTSTFARTFPRATQLAREKDVSVERLALAWVLSLSPTTIVISGASRVPTIKDAARATDLMLTGDDLRRLDF